MKKIFFSLTFFLFGLLSIVFAADPAGFLVEVNPSSFDTFTPVDFTVQAIKQNGTDIEKTYVGMVLMEIVGTISQSEWTLPNNGYYEFKETDQGEKTFSKGLEIKTAGTYKLLIYDILAEEIKGEATIIVGTQGGDTSDKKVIQIISPIQGVVERSSSINILGSCLDLPNSPYQVVLNGVVEAQGVTTEKGDISTYINNAREGENTLQIKITSVDNIVLGESDTVTFSYIDSTDEFFKSITVNPSSGIKQGDKVSFSISVDESVSSAELVFANGKTYPMDKTAGSTFLKEVFIDFDGATTVSVNLIVNGEKKTYTQIANVSATPNTTVGEIKFITDSLEKGTMTVRRTGVGTIAKYRIKYGTDRNSLSESVDVDTTEIELKNLDVSKTYFFQIVPLDANNNEIGTPSEIVEATPGHSSYDSTCVVKNIKISTEKIGDKRYLVRNAVENATKYTVYRSEYNSDTIANMNKVGETTETKFYYPFDNFAEQNEYAYYAVEAECSDGSAIQIDNVKKVQVGPVENLILFIVISLFFYSVYKLYSFIKND